MTDKMLYQSILKNHEGLTQRKNISNKKIIDIKNRIAKSKNIITQDKLCIFCAGSLARNDIGERSDLDLFMMSNQKINNLASISIFSDLINVNRDLGFSEFSNDGEYLNIYSLSKMKKTLGSPNDDVLNLFTVRMLLLLESKILFNDEAYQSYIEEIVAHYFRDKRGRKSFKPLFLMNDILRWWRTLCLNYELVRDEPEKPWRKKI